MSRLDDVDRISEALDAAVAALEPFTVGGIEARTKHDDDPVTAADFAVKDARLGLLPPGNE